MKQSSRYSVTKTNICCYLDSMITIKSNISTRNFKQFETSLSLNKVSLDPLAKIQQAHDKALQSKKYSHSIAVFTNKLIEFLDKEKLHDRIANKESKRRLKAK